MKFLRNFLASLLAVLVGLLILPMIFFAIVGGILGSMEKPVVLQPESVLKIDLAEPIVDSPNFDMMGQFDPQTMQSIQPLSLFRVLTALDVAKVDPNIKGIYLRMNGMGGVAGSGLAEELRRALEEFKQSGKFIVSYNETYTQGSYYLASVADKIYLTPQGGFEWMGLSSELMFYKGLFDKLGINVEIFRPTVCKYKSAVEPYFLDKMSAANREQMEALMHSMWGTISKTVAEARKIDPETLNRIADGLEVTLAPEALKAGFVDGVIYEDEMNKVFSDLGVRENAEGGFNMITLGEYVSLKVFPVMMYPKNQVAVVYADGEIVDGEGSGAKIFGNSLAEKIRKVRLDENVKAVVLRVNSPGGSALASDIIWREIELLRDKKPVVVSMGSYAASGGYYISSGSDLILANRMTLTGSIGVFGMIPNVGKALEKNLGVTFDGVKTNKEASMSLMRELSPVQKKAIMRGVDDIYSRFTHLVSDGRNLEYEKVLELAGGRVWSGADALEIGLADGIGGLKEAIALAVERAGMGEKFSVREVTDEATWLAELLSSLNSSQMKLLSKMGVMSLLTDENVVADRFDQLREAVSQRGIVMYCPYKLTLE